MEGFSAESAAPKFMGLTGTGVEHGPMRAPSGRRDAGGSAPFVLPVPVAVPSGGERPVEKDK